MSPGESLEKRRACAIIIEHRRELGRSGGTTARGPQAPATSGNGPVARRGSKVNRPARCAPGDGPGQGESGGRGSLLMSGRRGDGWRVTPGRGYPGPTSLASVSCLSESFCVAVGQHSSGDVVLTAAESFDGEHWRLERSPSVGVFSNLTGVACVSRDWCAAVGDRLRGQGSRTLVLRREGSWSLRPSPSRSFISGFAAVSCVSPTACVAVGARRDGANRTFVAGWDGSAWTIAATPSPAGSNILSAVSCVRAGHGVGCFAVGTSGPVPGIGGKPLVLSAAG